ncbi:hypothetical protein L1887_03213 [Cichorium endivia]|nr:hypothetical protein L1887_03213 [Cichorium endivia]
MNVKSAQGSSYRDRTHEFSNIAERLRKALPSLNASATSNNGGVGVGGGVSTKAEGPRSKVAIQTEFNKRASKIGYGIHQTSQKLAKLAKCELLDSEVLILNLKVHENRRQIFSASTSKEPANPFARQRPLANKSTANASNSPPPWVTNSSSSSPLFPRIDENMEDTLANVEGAQGQLMRPDGVVCEHVTLI